MIEWLVKVVLVIIAAQYIIGPIVVWSTQKTPEKYRFTLLDTQDFLADRSATFRHLHETIQNNNFEYIGSSELLLSNASMYFSLYNDFSRKISCMLVTAQSTPVNITYIELTQMYVDGSVLNVSNASIQEVYPKSEMKTSFRFPELNDFHKLLNNAQRLGVSMQTHGPRTTFERGREFETVEKFLNQELAELVKKGWMQEANHAGSRNLSIKGALLMTWKLLWPIKQLLNSNDLRRAQKALERAL